MLISYIILCLVVSIITIILFGADKLSSKNTKKKRIPESVLLSFVALGGAIGGLCGMYVFRHKTVFKTKFQFAIGVWISLILQVALAIFIALVQYGVLNFSA